jgi:hypothetical protein
LKEIEVKKAIAIAALAVVIGSVAAPQASAHTGNHWYWSKASAEAQLREGGVEWRDGTASDVSTIRCFPRGDSLKSSKTGRPLYRHWRCYGKTMDGYKVNVLMHVTGEFSYELTSY